MGVNFSGIEGSEINIPGNVAGGDMTVYERHFHAAAPAEPDAAALRDGLALLASMHTDALPPPGTLPGASRLPMGRNPLFTGREAELRALAALLRGEQDVAITPQAAATTGIGGMGKSQLANEFAWRYGRYFAGGVFWLSFAEAEAVPTEIALCGHGMAGLPTGYAELPPEELLRLVSARWQDGLPRLLIFDNCEEPALLERWKPKAGHCHLLVTARNSEWPPTLGVRALPLDTLPRDESVALLARYRDDLAAEGAALAAIAEELGDLPLALHLAGSFLRRYRVAPAAYLDALRATDPLEHPSMQGRGADHSPTAHDLHVGKTFALSYEKLLEPGEANERARALLERAALFLPGEPIPPALLLATLRGADEYDAADALYRLKELGLLEEGARGVRLHRLLASFALRYAKDEAALEDVEDAAISEAYRQNEAGYPAALLAWEGQLRYLTGRALARKPGLNIEEDVRAAMLVTNVAYHVDHLGQHNEAEPLYRHAHTLLQRALGAGHPLTVTSLSNLAYLYTMQSRYKEAEPLYKRALAIRERTLGAQHPETAVSLNNLAYLYVRQGQYGEAAPLFERALTLRERTLGPEHPETAISLNNLAALYVDQGRHEKAEPLQKRALEICERALGPEHPDTAASLSNLAGLFHRQKRYTEAELLYARALTICESVLGPEHPLTATSLINLSGIYDSQGRYSEAEPLSLRALGIMERTLGLTHPDTAASLNNLAALYMSQGRYGEAEPLYERALAICERALGAEHPNTATSVQNLVALYEHQAEHGEAELLYERALAVIKRVFGPEHPDAAQILHKLGALYYDQGRYGEAEPLFARGLAIRERALGAEHPDTAVSVWWSAVLAETMGRPTEAEPLYERALAIFEKALGSAHPNTEGVLRSLTALRARMGPG